MLISTMLYVHVYGKESKVMGNCDLLWGMCLRKDQPGFYAWV